MDQIQPFNRMFRASDSALFTSLTSGVVGVECWGWSRLYGGASTLHCGAPQPHSRGYERGEWDVTGWGCDAVLHLNAVLLDDRVDGRDELLAHLDALIGRTVSIIELDAVTLTLRVEMSGGAVLELVPDPVMEDNAWMMSLLGRQTLSADATGRWCLENNYGGREAVRHPQS